MTSFLLPRNSSTAENIAAPFRRTIQSALENCVHAVEDAKRTRKRTTHHRGSSKGYELRLQREKGNEAKVESNCQRRQRAKCVGYET